MSGMIVNLMIGSLGAAGVALLIRAKIQEIRTKGKGCGGNCSRCSGCSCQKRSR